MPHNKCFTKEPPAPMPVAVETVSNQIDIIGNGLRQRKKELAPKRVQAMKPHCVDDSDEKILSLNCQYCDYTISNRKSLLRHLKTHTDERPFTCPLCKREFKAMSSLIRHKSGHHSNLKQFQCNDCDSSFRSSGEIIRHIRYKHTHERPYKCTKCDHAFVERSKLTRHMWTHPKVNRHQCPHCPFTSSDAVKFKRHINIHNDLDYKSQRERNKCNECGLTFAQKQILKRHVTMCGGKNRHKDSVSMREIQDRDNISILSELSAISNYLIKGEVILLPEMDGEKYVMMKLISDDDEAVKAYNVELERNDKSDVDSDEDEVLTNIDDEEIEPFYGFDLSDVHN